MAYLILPSRRTRQPGSPVGIAASSLSNGLSFAFDGVVRRNAVNSNILASVNAPTRGAYADGMRTVFASASSQYIDCGTGPDVTLTNSDFTVAVRYSLTTAPASDKSMILFARDNSTGGRSYNVEVFRHPSNAAFSGLLVYVNGGGTVGTNMLQEGRFPAAGDDRFGVAVWSPSTNRSELWVDGILVVSNSAVTATPSATASARIGQRPYPSFESYLDGTIGYVAAWRRRLSAAEIVELSRNPWQIFAPDPRRIYFGASSGATAYTLDAQPGGYTVSGTAATLARGIVIDAQPATYTVSGTAATLVRGYNLNAQPGSYTATGTAASLVRGYVVDAAPGSFSLTGAAATLEKVTPGVYTLDAQPGSYSLTGVAATLTYTPLNAYTLDAQPATFTISGTAATLVYAGSSIWTDISVSATTWGDVGGATSIWTDL